MGKPIIKVSVRNMVEFILQQGDIDSGSGYASPQIMHEGIRIHRMLQDEAGENYESEVRLSCENDFNDLVLIVEGIADGIMVTNEGIIIDEIKTIATPLSKVGEDYNPLHWAQAKCYAWMIMSDLDSKEISIRLTYYNVESKEIKRFLRSFSYKEIKEFYYNLVQEYIRWQRLALNHQVERSKTIKVLDFPFYDYRKGQRELSEAVYRVIRGERLLYAQAPTGIGKTVSVMFPAVKALGEQIGEKIFYLTAKTITRQVAEQTIKLMVDRGLDFKSITLTAKEKICFCEEANCNPEDCIYAKGHFDRVNDAVKDILENESIITRVEVENYAKRHCVCPFEYSLDISTWVDLVICDYNYVFDPRAYLRRFFDVGGDYILLVDEAHNLVDRAREMYSAQISKKAFMKQKDRLKELMPKAYKEYVRINKVFIELRKSIEEKQGTITIDIPDELAKYVDRFTQAVDNFLAENRRIRMDEEFMDLFFSCNSFLSIYKQYDEHYVTYITKVNDELLIKLFCIDPSAALRQVYNKCRSVIFFSATLQPLDFYKDVLGGHDEDRIISLPSPFPHGNLCLMLAHNVSTRYRDRQYSYDTIAHYIRNVTSLKIGNYLVFFPSFAYMEKVYELYVEVWPEDNTVKQETNMKEEERENFIAAFEEDPQKSLVAFAVMGGIFSEGIDLKGNRLSGAVVVGVGLPQLSSERDLILKYFNKTKGAGFEYAYMYPGMNRVLQAAGRVIRTECDKGFVLLIDDRLKQKRYQNVFPYEWHGLMMVSSPKEAYERLRGFWGET